MIKENYFGNNAIKRQMQQNIKDKHLISKQSGHRFTKPEMRIGVYTKQIDNCLDNLVLAKQVPQFMKIKRKSEKRVTVLTKSEVSQISQTRQKSHIKFYNHTLVRQKR
jgi:hypothetical protein